jgi:hypothetical protein
MSYYFVLADADILYLLFYIQPDIREAGKDKEVNEEMFTDFVPRKNDFVQIVRFIERMSSLGNFENLMKSLGKLNHINFLALFPPLYLYMNELSFLFELKLIFFLQ